MKTTEVFGPDDIAAAVDIADMLEPVAQALVSHSSGLALSGPIGLLCLPQRGEAHLKSGYIRGGDVFVSKVATMCPHNRALGIPTSNGVMLVCDANTGAPVAVLHDAKRLTDLRTAAVGAIAAQQLSRKNSRVLAVAGTGGQALLQARAVAMVRPIHRILLWGRDTGRVRQTVASLRECLPGVSVEASHGLDKAVEAADIVVTTTASTAPLIHGSWLKPGQHVTAIGADDELKLELDRAAVERFDRRFVDGADVTARYGELALHHWANAVRPEVHGELGQLISGAVKGRSHDAQITLSKHVGLGVEDVAAAVTALEKLKELAR